MSYDPNRDPNSSYGNPPYGVPPQGAYYPPLYPYGPSPQAPYGFPLYQQPGYGYAAPPAAPLPLGEAIRQLPNQYLKVLTKPSAATFAEEQSKAAWNIVWVQLLALAVIAAVLGYFARLISSSLIPTTMSPAMQQAAAIESAFAQLIGVPLGFFIGVGILYLIARAFGGQGTFLAQGYTYLLFEVPLSIIVALLALIPILGALVAFAVGIYALVLEIFSIMAVHRLSGGKATLVVFLPVIVVLVLGCIVVVIIIAVLAASHP